MPRTGLNSQELVEEAIRIAKEKIRRHGIDKFRLSDIARELKVSHTALYNHLQNKAALLDEISERWLNAIDAALEEITRRDRPARELIPIWFREFHRLKLEKVRNDPELYKSFNMAVESDKPFVLQHLKNVRGQLLDLVQRAAAQGELRVASPAQAVEILFDATLAFHHPHLVWEHRDEEREPLLEHIVTALLAGLPEAV